MKKKIVKLWSKSFDKPYIFYNPFFYLVIIGYLTYCLYDGGIKQWYVDVKEKIIKISKEK